MGAKSILYTRPPMASYQLSAIFNDKRYGLIEASTKSGKTHACIVWLLEKALVGKDGHNFWWVAPVYKQAEIAYARLKRAIPKSIYKKDDTNLTLTLRNGARIVFKSGEKPDNLYGDDVYAIVVDEASRVREAAWFAVRSVVTATKGLIRIIGNVKGRGNWFYKLCLRARSGSLEDSAYAKITMLDAIREGVLPQSEYDDVVALYGEDSAIFRELYMAEPSEDGSNPFSLKSIEASKGVLSTLPAKHFGVDLAKSDDFTTIVGTDVYGRVSHLERWNMKQLPNGFRGTTYWAATVGRIREVIGDEITLVDSTGAGDPLLEQIGLNRPNVHGYTFSSMSKQKLMEGVAFALQAGDVEFPEVVDNDKYPQWFLTELESFEFAHKGRYMYYSAPDGEHDDGVMGLGLNVEARKPEYAKQTMTFY